jgi:aspartate carbamoyltransferase regulatory subunit
VSDTGPIEPGRERPQKQVAALRDGTVVDHLNAGMALKALEVIGLPRDGAALLGIHLFSEKMGRKDIIKLEGVELSRGEIDTLALFGPHVTVSLIRNYQVLEKARARLPDVVERILRCPNPNCITNSDAIDTRFEVESRDPLFVRCWHCERRLLESELQLLPPRHRGSRIDA